MAPNTHSESAASQAQGLLGEGPSGRSPCALHLALVLSPVPGPHFKTEPCPCCGPEVRGHRLWQLLAPLQAAHPCLPTVATVGWEQAELCCHSFLAALGWPPVTKAALITWGCRVWALSPPDPARPLWGRGTMYVSPGAPHAAAGSPRRPDIGPCSGSCRAGTDSFIHSPSFIICELAVG